MTSTPQSDRATASAPPPEWHDVHEVHGPLAGLAASAPLVGTGFALGPTRRTSAGLRHQLRIAPHTTASTGAFQSAFPAAEWRHRTSVRRIRLRVVVDEVAWLTVLRSDGAGTVRDIATLRTSPNRPATVEVDISGLDDGGAAWFDLHAGSAAVAVRHAAWQVHAPAERRGGMVLGLVADRPGPHLARQLERLADAPAALARLRRVLVLDTGGGPSYDPEVEAAVARLGRLAELRSSTPAFGPSGAVAEIMAAACATDAAAYAVVSAADADLDPLSLVRAHSFARRTTAPTVIDARAFDREHPADAADPAEADLAAPLATTRSAHRRRDGTASGWLLRHIPVEALERCGHTLLLRDGGEDVEFTARCDAAGVPTTVLPGMAVWLPRPRTRADDAAALLRRELLLALLAPGTACAPSAAAGVFRDLVDLAAGRSATVRNRHTAVRGVLAGPSRLLGGSRTGAPFGAPGRVRRGPALLESVLLHRRLAHRWLELRSRYAAWAIFERTPAAWERRRGSTA